MSDQLKIFTNIRNALSRDNYLAYSGSTEGGIPENEISIQNSVVSSRTLI